MKFISDISLFWLFPIGLVAFGLTFWFYNNQPWLNEVSKSVRRALFLLRFLALFFVGLLLLGILFESVEYRNEKPVLISLIDNSASLKNYKDSSLVLKQIDAFQQAVKAKYGDKFELATYVMGNDFRASDKVDLKDTKSKLAAGFDAIFSNYYNRNVGGIVCISDGNFNEGPNPIYSAEKIALTPIFTLGVGDTTKKKDQLIRDVSSNEIAFLKNKFPVEVDIEALKIGKRSSKVSIFHKGKVINSQTVNYENGAFDFKHLTFELEATEIGFQYYTVEVAPIQGEYTNKNNRRSFYIEVLDGRNKVILLAGAPHPDVAALKHVFEKDENVQVESKLVTDWDKKLDKVDLIVWHEPGINYSPAVSEVIQRSGKPVLYFVGPNTSNAVVQKLNVGMSFSSSNQTDEVQPGLNKGFELFEISTDLQRELNFFPPVKVRFGEVKMSPQNKIFLAQRLGEFTKKDPILFFGEQENRKYGVFFGEGIWRWKINEYSRLKSNSNFEELIQKVGQFLVVKQNASSLRISLPRRFTTGEEIKIKAEFYNEALELITKPMINFELTDEKGRKSNLVFAVAGNFYNLPLGTLRAGKYAWVATTSYNGKKHSKKGIFVVENMQLEALETTANHGVLQQISANSNASFYPLSQYQQLLNSIDKRDDIVEVAYAESAFNDLIDYFWILLLIVLLLSAEWFLKRYNGGY